MSSPGVVLRHSKRCPAHGAIKGDCDCEPTYQAWVYDPRLKNGEGGKHRRTFANAEDALKWRTATKSKVQRECTRDKPDVDINDIVLAQSHQQDRTDIAAQTLKDAADRIYEAFVAAAERPSEEPLQRAYRLIQDVLDLVQLAKRLGGDGTRPLAGEPAKPAGFQPLRANLRAIEISPMEVTDDGSQES